MKLPHAVVPLHLALGDHAAVLLRNAVQAHGLAGDVAVIPEDPSHGPLHDGIARARYMRALYHGLSPVSAAFPTDTCTPWRVLKATILPEHHVLLWHAETAAQHVFLRMVCRQLDGLASRLSAVTVPPDRQICGVGVHTAAALTQFRAAARELTTDERQALAAEFDAIVTWPGGVRRLESGRLIDVYPNYYDGLLLTACGSDWRPAAKVVGQAMGSGDPHNRMSDLFLCSRLQQLIDGGRMQVRGRRDRLRDYQVRLSAPAPDAPPDCPAAPSPPGP